MSTRLHADLRRAAAASAVAVATLAGLAQPARASDDAAQRLQVEQRVRLAAGLLGDAGMAQRVAGSGNTTAQSHLDEGRVHHAAAAEALARGDLAAARRNADEALRHLGLARRLAPDATARQAAAKARHEQMLASTERLIEAWRFRANLTGQSDGSALVATLGLVENARRQGLEGRYEEALQALAAAERQLLQGMGETLASRTLDYTARFANVGEEYQHELARHRSFAELVPLAIKDLKPKPEALVLIERYTQTSQTLRGEAQQRFEAGDVTQALTHIRSASMYLQRALQAAGLVTPTENPP